MDEFVSEVEELLCECRLAMANSDTPVAVLTAYLYKAYRMGIDVSVSFSVPLMNLNSIPNEEAF